MARAILDTIQRMLSLLIPSASSSSSFSKEPPPITKVDQQELQKLEKTMMRIHAVLDDAEESDIIDKSEQLRLRELKEIAYDAEDVMDDYEYEVLRAKVEARRKARESHVDMDRSNNIEATDWNSYHPEISISDDLTSRVREIGQRFEEITNEWNNIILHEKIPKRRCTKEWQPIESTSFLDEAPIFGRKNEKDQIMEWLLQEEPDGNMISVLSIIGMGGIGKTTLAQLVFNDPRVSKHFELKAWVCVSEDFDVMTLTRKIIISLSNSRDGRPSSHEHANLNSMSLDELCRILKNELDGNTFFLVLDDVWNQNFRLWHSLRRPLIEARVGKIIVTTRNESTARIMQTNNPIYLTNLSFDDCWSLFFNIAFKGRDHKLHHNLLDIGRKIVEKCKGLPLAVKVLASILRIEDEEEEWIDILQNELWDNENENNDILPALKLSYDRMPVELKPCFMYLSLFPKDSKLVQRSIVQQWMSLGFLLGKGKMTYQEEDIGNVYFSELSRRSILQKSNGWEEDEFVMHDLLHDLAQYVAKDEYLLITTERMSCIPKLISKTIRHASVYVKDDSEIVHFESLFKSKHLRTLLLHYVEECPIVGSLHNLTCLRVLICEGMNKKPIKLSDAIGGLKHLRYLGINSFDSTPESIYKLYHLKTLHLIFFDGSTNFCSGIGDLINLRHLRKSTWRHMHGEVGWLTNLQTLQCFKVGDESWQCKVRQLKDLINLRGHLTVQGLESVKWSDFSPAEVYLKATGGITRLTLAWNYRNDQKEGERNGRLAEQLLNCLQPHPNLVRLKIDGYPGTLLPSWLGDGNYFSKLEHLWLLNCSCTSLPTLAQLPKLKRLMMQAVKGIKSIGCELLLPSFDLSATTDIEDGESRKCCFPSLVEMLFWRMDEWEEWNGAQDSDFPCLVSLKIMSCPKLRRLPFLQELTQLMFSKYYNPEILSCSCLPKLRSLTIQGYVGDMLIFPDSQSLRLLNKLVISWGQGLRSVEGLGNLTSLQRLEIKECPILQIPVDVHLPPGLHPHNHVKIVGSPGAEKWYRDQVNR